MGRFDCVILDGDTLSDFKDQQALVTGGAGFIGSHIVDRLMRDGARVRVLDDMSNGDENNFSHWKDNERFEILIGDLRNRDVVQEAVKDVSVVFHQAAKVSVPVSVKNPHLVLEVNVMGTTTLLDECRIQDVQKVVVASSSSVYGDTPTLPKVESMPTCPISPYGVSKLAEENLAFAFYKTYGMNTTSLRYFNVYGPRQRGGAYAGVIQIFTSNALENRKIPIEGDGQQTRDFTFIEDVVECNMLAAITAKAAGNAYNVGRGMRITIENLADEIVAFTESTSTKEFLSPRQGDVRDSLASIEKGRNHLGYDPKWNIKEGLAKTIEWFKNK